MKITIESTSTIIPGVGRLWSGVTEGGTKCQVIVACLGADDANAEGLAKEMAALSRLGDSTLGVLRLPDGVPQ